MRLRFRSGGGVTLLGGTFVLVLLALAGYYYFRSTANESRLRDRNLRELARIGRTIEARINNFESVLKNLATNWADLDKIEARQAAADNIPGLSVLDDRCPREYANAGQVVRLYVRRHELHFCHKTIHVSWGLAELQRTLRSAIFEQLLLADASGTVLLTSSDTSALRLRQVPRPRSDEGTPRTHASARSEPSNPKQNNSHPTSSFWASS